MRIDQIIPDLRYGNEISNAVVTLQKIIRDLGCGSDTYTETMQLEEKENIIYHMFIRSLTSKTLSGLKSQKKVLFYHGVVPPELKFDAQDWLEELRKVKDQFVSAFTTTKHLEQKLREAGYLQTIVLPPPVDLKEYDQEPDLKLLKTYEDEYTNVLFVGQIIPANKLENIISVFNYYHKKLNPKSRLFLVGSFSAHPQYCQKLLALIKELVIENVFLTGRVSFKQLLAYYRLSKVFLCMSEYEGFLIPLIEAMYLKVPVIISDPVAMQEVLGGSGCLIIDQEIRETARLLNSIVNDQAKREEIISLQTERLTGFLPENVFPLYRKAIVEAFN